MLLPLSKDSDFFLSLYDIQFPSTKPNLPVKGAIINPIMKIIRPIEFTLPSTEANALSRRRFLSTSAAFAVAGGSGLLLPKLTLAAEPTLEETAEWIVYTINNTVEYNSVVSYDRDDPQSLCSNRVMELN